MQRRGKTRTRRSHHSERYKQLERRVLADLALEGSLTFAEAAGLSASDLDSLAEHAEQLRRQGALDQAAQIYELLVTFDPHRAQWWKRTQDLQLRCGNAEASLMAFRMLEMLDAVDAESQSRGERVEAQLGL